MFETSGTTDVLEKSPWQKYVLWFAAGCLVTILIFYMLLIPSAKRAAAESAEKAAQQKLSAELAKNPVQAQTGNHEGRIADCNPRARRVQSQV